MYTVSTGFLTKPYLSIYQHRQSQDLPRLVDDYLSDRARRPRYSTKSSKNQFVKQTKGKRFFEFSPLAFDRQTYRLPGNKPFRIFDVKRFFQYSPFIARLQRSHSKPKFENSKPRSYAKPVVDHFSGFQRWEPLSKSILNNPLSSPIKSWQDNENRVTNRLENKDNSLKTDVSSESEDTIVDKTKQPVFNDKSEIVPADSLKIESVPSDVIRLSNADIYPNHEGGHFHDVKVPTVFNDWRSTTEPKPNTNKVIHLDVSDKLKPGLGEFVSTGPFSGGQSDGDYISKENDRYDINIHPDTVAVEHSLTHKPTFGFQEDFAQTQNTPSFGWGDGFGPVNSFGSTKHSETLPSNAGGFGNVIYDSPVLHSKPSPGVWGSFVEDTARPEPTLDAIPVPPLPSVIDTNVSILNSFLWDIGKQNSPRCDAAEHGVPSGAILFA